MLLETSKLFALDVSRQGAELARQLGALTQAGLLHAALANVFELPEKKYIHWAPVVLDAAVDYTETMRLGLAEQVLRNNLRDLARPLRKKVGELIMESRPYEEKKQISGLLNDILVMDVLTLGDVAKLNEKAQFEALGQQLLDATPTERLVYYRDLCQAEPALRQRLAPLVLVFALDYGDEVQRRNAAARAVHVGKMLNSFEVDDAMALARLFVETSTPEAVNEAREVLRPFMGNGWVPETGRRVGDKFWVFDMNDEFVPVKSYTYMGLAPGSERTHILVETGSKHPVKWQERDFDYATTTALGAYELGEERILATLARFRDHAQQIRDNKFFPERGVA